MSEPDACPCKQSVISWSDSSLLRNLCTSFSDIFIRCCVWLKPWTQMPIWNYFHATKICTLFWWVKSKQHSSNFWVHKGLVTKIYQNHRRNRPDALPNHSIHSHERSSSLIHSDAIYGAIWCHHVPSVLPLRLGRLSSSARRRCCSPPMGLGEAKLASPTKNISLVQSELTGMFKIDTKADWNNTLTLKQFQTLHVHCILQPVDLNVEKLCRLAVCLQDSAQLTAN